MLHYVQVGKKVIEHVLVYPGGLLVVTARDVPGKIYARGNRWKRSGTSMLRIFGMSGPQLGNPALDTDQSIVTIEQKLKEAQLEYDVYGIILFTASVIELDIEGTDFDAIAISELANFVRHLEVDPAFKNAERDQLVDLLAQGDELERTERSTTRRPVRVKRRAMSKT
jgi:hypothetical protein